MIGFLMRVLCPPRSKSRPGAGHVFNNVLSENNLCFSFQLSEFQCEDGKKCIQKYQKCNHRSECEDNSDEKDCSKFIFPLFHSLQLTSAVRGVRRVQNWISYRAIWPIDPLICL